MGAEGASLLTAGQSLRPMDGAKLIYKHRMGVYIVIDFNRSMSAILRFFIFTYGFYYLKGDVLLCWIF